MKEIPPLHNGLMPIPEPVNNRSGEKRMFRFFDTKVYRNGPVLPLTPQQVTQLANFIIDPYTPVYLADYAASQLARDKNSRLKSSVIFEDKEF